MHVIWTLIIGLIAGFIARLLVPGHDVTGWAATLVLGVGGAFLARWVGIAMGYYRPGSRIGFFSAVLGAVILLVIYHLFRRFTRRETPHRPG